MPGALFPRPRSGRLVARGAVALQVAALFTEEAETGAQAALHIFRREIRHQVVRTTLRAVSPTLLHHRIDALVDVLRQLGSERAEYRVGQHGGGTSLNDLWRVSLVDITAPHVVDVHRHAAGSVASGVLGIALEGLRV